MAETKAKNAAEESIDPPTRAAIDEQIRTVAATGTTRKAGAEDLAAAVADAVSRLDAYAAIGNPTAAQQAAHLKLLTQIVRKLLVRLAQLA